MFINERMLKEIKEGNYVTYLFEITTNNNCIYLTTSDVDVEFNGNKYLQGYFLQNLKIADLENKDELCLKIPDYFDDIKINIEDLLQSIVKIRLATIKNTQVSNSIIIFNGFISKINSNNNTLEISLQSKIMKFNSSICHLFSPLCRECFGSKKCGINLEHYKTQGIITKMISQDCFIGNHQENRKTPVAYYKYGILKMLTGKLCGISLQIKDEQDGVIYLLKNTTLLSLGDRYEIFAGCDKTLATCKEKFNNVINFRGEPFIENT